MTTLDTITEHARAKINLTLHVTGQMADGYHLLDSLVLFASLGDVVTVRPDDDFGLTINGPFSGDLDDGEDNLVTRAAALMDVPATNITLTKNLPVASGIGGGSADAAATLRALARLWNKPLPDLAAQLRLGADVPVCMSAELTRMGGIGDLTERLGPAPMLDMLLVNPGVAVPTPQVFAGLASKTNTPMTAAMPDPFDINDWTAWLCRQRNDLEGPARDVAPIIDDVLYALNTQPGCTLARMSGSGATCFAIFDDADLRDAAATAVQDAHPDWWVKSTDEAPL